MRLAYRADPGALEEIRRLVAAENDCCNVGGVRFELDTETDGYEVRIGAPEDSLARADVQAVFAAFGRSLELLG